MVEQRVVEFIGRHLMITNVRGRFPEVIQRRAAEKGDPYACLLLGYKRALRLGSDAGRRSPSCARAVCPTCFLQRGLARSRRLQNLQRVEPGVSSAVPTAVAVRGLTS